MDLTHLLSAVVGALFGLVVYSVLTPGHLPDDPGVELRDPRMDLFLREMGGRLTDGYFVVEGKVYNARPVPCRRASIAVTFVDGDKALTRTIATVQDVPPRGYQPFDVKAYAPGAKSFQATVELAQF